MAPQDQFRDLVVRVRAGDQDAATELARVFEPFIVRYVRFAMRKRRDYKRIRPRLGSADICQSVFKSLFVGLKEGRFELNQPDQLERLLRVMSRFKIATEGRRLSVILREVIDGDSPPDRTDSGASPEKPIDDQDLVENVVAHFFDDELELLHRRLDGETWPSIAAQLGVNAESLRKKLERAIERVRNVPSLHAIFHG
jgi:DNA-directed RNA polymerase specialized sigma24 family protein